MSPQTPPPWMTDKHPDRWLPVSTAAKYYFHRSIVTVKQWIKTGYLKQRGVDSYWDGTRWYVRLPDSASARKVRIAKTERDCG